jgi:L-lactate utilization protein LutB
MLRWFAGFLLGSAIGRLFSLLFERNFECTRVCPKDIPITSSINTIKREIGKRLKEI